MNRIISLLFVALAALLLTGCGAKELKKYDSVDEMIADARESVSFVTPEELKDVLLAGTNGYYLIDCREAEEFEEACILGAINIPRGLLEDQVSDKAPRKRNIVYIYCDNEDKSVLAASILPGLKHSKVKVVQGGFDAVKEQYPALVENSPVRDTPKADVQTSAPAGCGG